MPEKTDTGTGWLPDLIYRDGRFDAGMAMFADASGRISRFSRAAEDLRIAQRLPGKAILPGLVNVHSHSFQRAIRGRTESRTQASRDTFWTWREAMYHAATRLSPEDIHDVACITFLECVRSGITAIGEFHYLHHQTDGTRYADPNLLAREILQAAGEIGLRIELQRTLYMRAGWMKSPNPGQARFITLPLDDFIKDTEALERIVAHDCPPGYAWVGIAPHSIRAVPIDCLVPAVEYARSRAMKVHMHVSEQPAENEACQAEYGLRPVELLDRHGVLDPAFTAIHATHITNSEAEMLGRANASICACPTTERNLGDGIGDARLWVAAGIAICFGSDSNIQIDLLEDARALEYHLRLNRLERAVLAPDLHPGSLAQRLFAAAASAGAASIGSDAGVLEVGRPADFFCIDLNDLSVAGADAGALLSNVIFSAERTAIRDVYVSGRPVVQEGHHKLEEKLVASFARVQQKLWGEMG
jgi:formimidoylglutamate deiminase